MSLLDQVQKVRGETNSVSNTQVTTTSSGNNSLLERVQIQRGELQPTVTQPIIAKPNLIQQAKTAIGSAINKRKVTPINTNISLTGQPGKNIINQIDLGQPGQQQSAQIVKPQQAVSTATGPTISQTKPQSKWQKISQKLQDFLYSPEDQKAKDMNIASIQKVYAKKGQEVPTKFIKDNFDDITKELGIRGVPKVEEIAQLAMSVALVAGLIEAPIATAVSVAGFTALGKVKEKVAGSLKEGAKDFTDLLPENTPDPIKRTFKAVEFLAEIALLKKIGSKSPQIKQMLTKDVIEKYDVKPIELSAKQVKDIFQTGKLTTAEQKALFGKVNTGNVAKEAMKNGITITPEQLLEVRDKPLFAKIKKMFGIGESAPTVISQREVTFKIGGREVKINIKQPETLLLSDGTYTPQEVLNKVIGSELQNTTDGKALVKTALEANKTGSEITIGAKTEIKDLNKPFNEETTKKTIDATLAGEREDFRLDTQENIKKYSQGLAEATPEDTIIVYRAGNGDIGPGDFVTSSEERASTVYLTERPGSELLQKEVKLSDLTHGGGLKSEFVYAPKEVKQVGLSEYYNSQDQEVFGQAHFEVMSELDVAEAGKRLFNENGEIIGGQDSTFPDWIPSELRLKPLLEGALKDLSDPTKMVFPPNSQPRKQALYEEILREIDSRSGTDSSPIIESIKNAKETKVTTTKETTNEVAKTIDRSTQGTEGTTGSKENLIQEAKKYKSAEEFIQAQGEPLLHGTTKDFKEFDLSKAGTRNNADQGFAGKGIYLTNSKEVAETFSTGKDIFKTEGETGNARIIEAYLNKDINILKVDSFGELSEKLGLEKSKDRPSNINLIEFTNKQAPIISEKSQEQGYDAIQVDGGGVDKYGTQAYEVVVFNPDQIKTTSQLTDIYNQANKQDTEVTVEQKARESADKVLQLMGNSLKDISIIGSTANGKLKPNDLDILITPDKKLDQLTTENLYGRMDLQKVFKDELESLFPDKVIHITIAEYDAKRGSKISISDLNRTPEQLAQTLEPSTEDIPRKDGYSRLQERLEEQLLDANGQKYNWDDTKKTYDKISLKADAEKAIDLLEKNPEKALRIANGFEDPGEKDPVLLDVMNAVALKAFDEGNVELGTRMVNKASLTATRYGQNIASLRGNFNNNSPQNFIKQVISARMDKLGSSSLAEVEKLIGRKSSAKTKATTKIDLEVEKLKKKVDRKLKLKENKIKLAQDIIESLKCK